MPKPKIPPELVQAIDEGGLHYELEQSITRTATLGEQEKRRNVEKWIFLLRRRNIES